MNNTRTVISAVDPFRYEDSYTEIWLTVWFEEFNGPLRFLASPFDPERHGKALWIRAMAGEFGEITVGAKPVVDVIEPEPKLPPMRMLIYANG